MKLNTFIDHTLLKPIATEADIITLCEEAKTHQFFSVCVNSCYVKLAKKQLKNTDVKVCSVIGFPLGAMSTKAKIFETKQAKKDGADEIDMVLNIGALKSRAYKKVKKDIKSVKKILPKNTLKVILETCFLTDEEIVKACELAIAAGADFIKTSTGFGTAGATVANVKLMKRVVNGSIKIKASGGIRNTAIANTYISAGADRIGTSSGVEMMKNV